MMTNEKNGAGTVTMVMVPIRYPVKAPTVRTLHRAIEIADQFEQTHLFVLHVNLQQNGDHISRSELARAVSQTVGMPPNASYHVRTAYLLEEMILYEAVRLEADYVIMGAPRKARWRRHILDRLTSNVDLETYLRTHLKAELVVVPDQPQNSTRRFHSSEAS